jgi:hypothetical protein
MRIRYKGVELPEVQSEILNTVLRRKGMPFLQLAAERPESDADVAEAVRALKDHGIVTVENEDDDLRKTVVANFDALSGLETVK